MPRSSAKRANLPSHLSSIVPTTQLPRPTVFAASQPLTLDSTLAELALHDFQAEACHSGLEIARVFEQYPLLPGVIVREQGRFLGMISRQRLLEFLIRTQGIGLLLKPLSVIYSHIRSNSLILSEGTSILSAAQLALRRSPNQQSEPLVVQFDDHHYRLLEIHELNLAHWQLRGLETQSRYERTQIQMIRTEKMASLGRLVDGVAHEILDPVGFIWGNLVHLSTYANQLIDLLALYETHFSEVPLAIAQLQNEIELDYVREDLPQTIGSITAGAERLKALVTSLQNFCHIDDVYPKPADLHECLESILLLLKSRLSGEITVVRNYGPLPPVVCYAGQLNQVFMNILSNAVDALLNQSVQRQITKQLGKHEADLEQRPLAHPQITITTQVRSLPSYIEVTSTASRWVCIRIADNGPGLSPEKQQQIVEAFSMRRRSDKETSLSVSYQIITVKHGGMLSFHSLGQAGETGTEFEVWLPLV
jgi:signal transduction histidine kinase